MSAQLRRKIGIARKQLTRAVNLCEEDLKDDLPGFLQTATNDDLLDYAELQDTHHESLSTKLRKLEDLNNEWIALMAKDSSEVATFHEFISKYGDYRDDIEKAIKALQRMDSSEALIQEELEKRGIAHAFNTYSTQHSQNDGNFPHEGNKEHVTSAPPHREGLPPLPTSTQPPLLPSSAYFHPTLPNSFNQPLPSTNHPLPALSTTRPNTYPSTFQQETQNLNYFDASLLTRLDLPSFSGNLLEFPEFWARYHALIHCKTTLSGATKFSLLKSCLRGRALHTIDGLPVTDDNYAIAIDILLTTYDNPSTLRHLIYTQLSSLPQCDPDGKQLQDLYLRMLRLVRQYTAITPYSPEFALGALLYNKLPRFVRARIYDMTGGQKNLTPSELITLLEEIVRKESTLRQMDASTTSHQTSYHVSEKAGRHLRPIHNQQEEYQSRSTTPQGRPTPRCPFCNRMSHNAMQCRIVQTPEDRRKFAKTSRMCLKCLQQGHRTITCTRPPCHKCRYHHHPALCFKIVSTTDSSLTNRRPQRPSIQYSRQQGQEHVTPHVRPRSRSRDNANERSQTRHPTQTSHHVHFSDGTSEENKQAIAGEMQEPSSSYAAVNSNDTNHDDNHPGNSILLMCTKVTLMNPEDNSKKLQTVAFLDSGSSHSYITTDIATQLELRETKSENITLHTFGTRHPTTLSSQLHTLQVLLEDQTPYTVSAQSLPILTQALKIPAVTQNQIATTAQDADIPTTSSTPGILIGMDHFWNLVLSPSFYSVVLPNGYHLLNTRLGKVISGKKLTTRTINSAINEIADHPMSKTHLDEMVERFWKCESLGIGDEATRSDDIACLDFFNSTTRYDEAEQRYYTRLPFKHEQSSIPDNFDHSLACLRSNWKTLSKKPEYLDKYDNIIQDQLQRGIIGKPPSSQSSEPGTFLSHHAVINESKKQTKIRLVYNGSARSYEQTKTETTTKILGLTWNIPTDTIIIRLPFLQAQMDHPTKRSVLKVVASIYDPLGFIAPLTVVAKIFLQSLWKDQMQWDELLSEDKRNNWLLITSTWTQPYLEIPRRILPSVLDSNSIEIHIFTDASRNAYCAVAYLRIETSQHVETALLMARTRLAPLHGTVTIPRLELSGLTLGSALMNHLTKELKITINGSYIWSDSKTALQWTKTTSNLPVFVQNRIKAIRKNAPDTTLRYVPTTLNPADSGSRGSTIQELNFNHLWWYGPTFLRSSKSEWPEDVSESSTTPIVAHSATNTTTRNGDSPIIDNLMTLPTWSSLLRVMSMIIMFINNTRIAIAKRKGTQAHRLNCTQTATITLFRQAQLYNPITPEQKTNLRAYYDTETRLWRSRGRTSNSSLSFDTNNPVILPRHSWITTLYILHVHTKHNHIGTSQTLTTLRQLVWIPQGRAEVQRVIKKFCFYCRREKAAPFHLPPFPDHPKERVTKPAYPFCNTAVDYLGPFNVENHPSTTKVWIALFTCLNTRAICVDIASSLSAICFLQILRRFIATNGTPKWLLSDNAPAFVTVSNVMPSPIKRDEQDVIDYCAAHNIRFKFVAALAPWQGGVYERMIGVFKTSFKAAVKNRTLDFDEFNTLMKECEAIVNSRPLTYVYSDIDSGFPLRPIDFLRPHSIIGSPRLTTEEDDDDDWKPTETPQDLLQKQWNSTISLLNRFWQRWQEEYLTSLRENFQHEHRQPHHTSSESPFDDQIVLVHDSSRPRGQWKLGRIMSHSDHSATIKLPNGHTITRPLSLLYPLEIPPSKAAKSSTSDASQTQTAENSRNIQLEATRRVRTHPMMTRSRTRQLPMTILAIVCIISFASADFAAHNPPDTKCDKYKLSPRHIIHSDQCAHEGIVIATTKPSSSAMERIFCWFHVSCPLGHIRVSLPFQPNNGYCGDICKCPEWTNTCSHYDGKLTTTSSLPNLPITISDYRPTQVCSFNPSSLCSSERRLGAFYQIQLYDDSLVIVPELHLKTAEFFSKDDFTCFNIQGHKLATTPNPSETTGTPAYCRRYPCISPQYANTFCAYSTPVTIYHHNNDTIIIKAWGTTTRTYYPPLESSQTPSLSSYIIPRCTVGGILIDTTEQFDMVETCSSFACVYISNYSSNSKILLPSSIVIFQYTVKLTAWREGKQVFQRTQTCEGKPICEILDCFICWEHIFNPHCWTTTEIVITIASSLLLIITCRLISPALLCAWWLLKKLIQTAKKCLVKMFTCGRRSGTHTLPSFPSYRRPSRRTRKVSSLILLVYITAIQPTNQCSHIVATSSTSQYCESNSTDEQCYFDQATTLQLQPIGQDVSLLLRNSKNEPAGTISIRVQDIAYTCRQKTEYYTRDHKFYTESHHQCWNSLSCKGETCKGVTTSTNIAEFSSYAKKHPGFTYCSPSCKCLWCDWCFWCKETCLFYKVYAYPESKTTYRVFTCPAWSVTVAGTIVLETSKLREKHDFVLHPARPHTWNKIELTLTATTVPNLPILSSYFLTDGEVVSKVEQSPAGQLIPHSVGQLQCTSENSARTFSSCTFSATACTCTPRVYEATCNCPEGNIRRYIDNSQLQLPLAAKDVVILQRGADIQAKTTSGSSTSVQVSMRGLTILTKRLNNECQIDIGSLTGCFSCIQGARLQASCTSSLAEETAEIRCGNQTQLAMCSPHGKISELVFHFTSSSINMNCSVICPAGQSTITIQGSLDYVNNALFQAPIQQVDTHRATSSGFSLDTMSHALSTILSPIANVVELVLEQLAKIQSPPTHLEMNAVDVDNFCLVAVVGARERRLKDDFAVTRLQSPWNKGRLFVRRRSALLAAVEYGNEAAV
ncbi:Pao retrotransposon peptidase [Ancylostoma ceylanicum]|uniref:Pao retrotransposon peptidase n=2 Tax=Ancylostoma ceylanicum TaxID=53326 RepID=A0A0D6LSV8_9BILA|nr:Pao retrotransposon peptidase [Ancylostoma ceylanicum]